MAKSESLKILHCADLHIGLRFSRYPEEIASELREARFRSLEQLVDKANREACQLFVVAGDLFDTLKVAQRDLVRVAKILSRFDRVVAVLPGNHDFHAGASDDFWRLFERPDHGRLLLLSEQRPYSLAEYGIEAVLYPAPCGSKYSESHGLGWLEKADRPAAQFHIGLAHGSFEGLSPDLQGNYFPMRAEDLQRFRLDLWLLGHIHVQYPPRSPGNTDRIFYSGTHEPDGFDCRHEGKAWLLELGLDKSLQATSLSSGNYRFREEEVELRSLADLEAFAARFSPEESARTLLKLKVRGSLTSEEHSRFGMAMASLQPRFFYLQPDYSSLAVQLSPEDIDREFSRDSFPHRLLSELMHDASDREALQLAYDLLKESAQ